jgi:hypothetical protein
VPIPNGLCAVEGGIGAIVWIEYDAEVDAAFLWFVESDELQEGAVVKELWPPETNEHIGLLFNSLNQLVGVEVLFATRYLPKSMLGGA